MADLASAFPNLTVSNHRLTSPVDGRYNCIAFAAADTESWWWPTPQPIAGYYWPPNAPRETTLEAFKLAFQEIGYEECLSGDLVSGKEKVAIYVNKDGTPTHAARQLPSGEWTSKLGKHVDIAHATPDVVGGHENAGYGDVALYMVRDTTT